MLIIHTQFGENVNPLAVHLFTLNRNRVWEQAHSIPEGHQRWQINAHFGGVQVVPLAALTHTGADAKLILRRVRRRLMKRLTGESSGSHLIHMATLVRNVREQYETGAADPEDEDSAEDSAEDGAEGEAQ